MLNQDIRVCKKCGKKYRVRNISDQYPGGKEKEELICPWCKHVDGKLTTSGWVETEKVEDTMSNIV